MEQEVLSKTEKFELTLSLQDSVDAIVRSVNYASNLFERSTVKRYVECFKSILSGMTRSSLNVSRLPSLSEKERKAVV